jgi:uncharacterized cupin superfamily protein
MDGIRTEGEFWRRSLTYLSDLITQLSGGVSITNDITDPIPVQQGDLNADVDEVSIYEGAMSIRVDQVSSTQYYLGEAVPNSSEASAVWRVREITLTNPIKVKWAGTAQYDQVWANRAGLTYT